jgi:predicted RNA-binding protein YlxR (DUF448 family)
MKFFGSMLLLSCCCACATRTTVDSNPIGKNASATMLPPSRMPKVRTSQTVKAYPVGRYTDPNFPDAMHERHTLYRREQSTQWDYRPSKPYALPLGPTIAESNPSRSYYVKTNSEQMNAQQKAYAESLLEQNRAMKKRLDTLMQNESITQQLRQEVERLKKELEIHSLINASASDDTIPKPTP